MWEEDLRKKQYKMVPGRTNLRNWRLSLKQRSIVDLLEVLEFLNSYSEARNSMQRKTVTIMGFLAITHTEFLKMLQKFNTW